MSRYQDFEERPEREWVLYYVRAYPPATFNARLFPNMDRARTRYGNTCKDLYESPEELAVRFGGGELLDAYRYLNSVAACKSSLLKGAEAPHRDDVDEELRYDRKAIARHLWELLQDCADRVHGLNLLQEDDDTDLFIIRLDRMTATPEVATTYNKQKRIIFEGLLELGKTKATEEELQSMMRQLSISGRLKTKQDPWRIFKYYAPELGDEGFVYYPSKRHKREDHDLNS